MSLVYSDKSSTNATISLDVGDEMTRDSCHPGEYFKDPFYFKLILYLCTDSITQFCFSGPSRSNNNGTLDAGPSNNCNYHHYNDIRESTYYLFSFINRFIDFNII